MIALGGAAIVYRGATLAYAAAMAKVDLDREATERSDRRRRLALYLKIIFATRIMRHEAELLLKRLRKRPQNQTFVATSIQIKSPAVLDEAWNSLDLFPMTISEKLSVIRASYYNFELYSRRAKVADPTGGARCASDLFVAGVVRSNNESMSRNTNSSDE
jgi:hypothetical protein